MGRGISRRTFLKFSSLIIGAGLLKACAPYTTRQVTKTPLPTLESTVTPTPTPKITPSPTSTPTPSQTPTLKPTDVPPTATLTKVGMEYPIREGFVQKVRAEVLGVPVSIDVVVDKGLQIRKANPVQRVYLNPAFPNAEKAVAEATMMALWYAWRENELDKVKDRQYVSFQEWMGMIKEYRDGRRPLSDVEMEIWANDLMTADYDPEPRRFDPTRLMRFVFVDRDDTNRPEIMAIYRNTVVYSSNTKQAVGTQLAGNGILEIWSKWWTDSFSRNYSQIVTSGYGMGINRLSWSRLYQEGDSPPNAPASIVGVHNYHPEVGNGLLKDRGGVNNFTGALQLYPNAGS